MSINPVITSSFNENAEMEPYKNLHLEFHRAIFKRLVRKNEGHLMKTISKIYEIDTLDTILEGLLEGKDTNYILSLI
ncbi:MAG: hypothetical protein PF689_04705 [Deltaproteobacteria bacterium]|jgi:DNA-directed RNA polymerase subunit E'/Rpb7|nr:hypothetical protein [Deltaproteobacteria bacterium]